MDFERLFKYVNIHTDIHLPLTIYSFVKQQIAMQRRKTTKNTLEGYFFVPFRDLYDPEICPSYKKKENKSIRTIARFTKK